MKNKSRHIFKKRKSSKSASLRKGSGTKSK